MKFPMIHADEQGETHFGVEDIADRSLALGPPPNPSASFQVVEVDVPGAGLP